MTDQRTPPASKEPVDDKGIRLHNVYNCLAEDKYPLGASKDEKGIIRKKSNLSAMDNSRTGLGEHLKACFEDDEIRLTSKKFKSCRKIRIYLPDAMECRQQETGSFCEVRPLQGLVSSDMQAHS